MVSRLVILLFHVVTFVTYAIGIFYDVNYVKIPVFEESKNFGGKWKYLTFLNLVAQAVYFGIAVACDIQIISRNVSHSDVVSNKKVRTGIIKCRDCVFTVVGFPVSLFVFGSFWGLYAIDRNLIFPPFLELYIPSWLNHIMHTIILPTSLIELTLLPHQYVKRGTGLFFLTLLMIGYVGWTLIVFYVSKFWTYPILDVLNWWQMSIFFAVDTGIVASFYLLGEKGHKMCWGKLEAVTKKTV